MTDKISVVIPVYSVEKYLHRCVDSVINQTYSSLEIILVDDGSPDQCPAICDQYAEQDNRIKVIHKTNGGLASARNAGMKVATGKYLFFVDSDDWLDPDGLEKLYRLAEEYNVDFVRYRSVRENWPGLPSQYPTRVEKEREMHGGYYSKTDIVEEIYPRLFATSSLTLGPIVGAWGSLYKTSLLKERNIMFHEEIKYSEDVLFSAEVVVNADSFYYLDDAGIYHYFYNDSSISKSFRKDRWESCKAMIQIAEKEFLNRTEYDFKNQMTYLRWFCIFLSLNERKYLTQIKEKEVYCRSIMKDPVTKETPLNLSLMDVSFKRKVLMIIVKQSLARIMSLI
ncbi:MAG: glycosyltransferase [Erysipelotrichaceae bacterium]|nr:glycosyltransferase [Erysipelotrichaceae bacterium]